MKIKFILLSSLLIAFTAFSTATLAWKDPVKLPSGIPKITIENHTNNPITVFMDNRFFESCSTLQSNSSCEIKPTSTSNFNEVNPPTLKFNLIALNSDYLKIKLLPVFKRNPSYDCVGCDYDVPAYSLDYFELKTEEKKGNSICWRQTASNGKTFKMEVLNSCAH